MDINFFISFISFLSTRLKDLVDIHKRRVDTLSNLIYTLIFL